ncbi:MAG: hypothetical protein ING71_02335 [Rhodocyclaceae bacterium]|jgi:hypothetical protein|nr:hypothetical protein [Rhodocyclaceae bacterium]MCA3042668.1 hypothetical protein [Rhodocyclaceae bacterium]MCA3057804.1 hypothetical protein [Rhodocyclaceae bacterium]MCA3077616.1 hypothetical protein [Rhodocyclaceae bacterium]MCA3082001.1 hypothetical protein [Rhodocyclaceae bacterium]
MKDDPPDDEKTKGAAPFPENAPFEDQQSDDNKSLKWRTTLSHLLRGPRHRFDAERWGDHAIPSTVSSLQRDYGLKINREWRKVPTRFGTYCLVKAYWVDDLSRNHAMRLVARRKRRKNGGKV